MAYIAPVMSNFNSKKLETILLELVQNAIHDDSDNDEVSVYVDTVETFEGAEILTNDNGLVIRCHDGEEFTLTINRFR